MDGTVLFAQTADIVSGTVDMDAAPWWLPWLLGLGIVFPYLALRVRDAGSDRPDPDLGAKVAYHFFLSVGVLTLLFGAANLTVALMIPLVDYPPGYREVGLADRMLSKWAEPSRHHLAWPIMFDGWAMISTGLTLGCGSAALIHLTTNVRSWPAVRRVFAGWRLVVVGMVVALAVFDLNQIAVDYFLRGDKPYNLGRLQVSLALLGVFGPAFGVHVWLMRRYSRLPYYAGPDGD
jgi:hypothetical protein